MPANQKERIKSGKWETVKRGKRKMDERLAGAHTALFTALHQVLGNNDSLFC